MKDKFTILFALLFTLSLSSCIGIKPLTSFYIEKEYEKPDTKKLETPLRIELFKDVEDQFSVTGTGTKSMQVLQFRRYFKLFLEDSFGSKFTSITADDYESEHEGNEEELRLVIYNIKSSWRVRSTSASTRVSNGNSRGYTNVPNTEAVFDLKSSLYKGEQLVKEIDLKSTSSEIMSHPNHAHNVFKDGLVNLQEELQNEIINAIEAKKS